jgi:hypothetical protein
VDNKKQTPLHIKTDHSIPRFIVAPGINKAKKWVKKDRRRLLKANPFVLGLVADRFSVIPDKVDAIQVVVDIHADMLINVMTLSIQITQVPLAQKQDGAPRTGLNRPCER